ELGVAVVAYSPIGRGWLSGTITSPDQLSEGDFRRTAPRFSQENFDANLALVERVKEIAAEIGCTPAQAALAWLLAQGEDIVAIPGTKRVRYLEENAAADAVTLTDGQLERLSAAVPVGAVKGERYPEQMMRALGH